MISRPNSYGFKRDIINPNTALIEDFSKTRVEGYFTKNCDGNIVIDRPKRERLDAFLNRISDIEDTKVRIFDDIIKTIDTIHKGLDADEIKALLISLQKKEEILTSQIRGMGNEDSDHNGCVVSSCSV